MSDSNIIDHNNNMFQDNELQNQMEVNALEWDECKSHVEVDNGEGDLVCNKCALVVGKVYCEDYYCTRRLQLS